LFLVVLGGTIAAAAVSWRFIEAPVNQFRHRLGRTPGALALVPSPVP